MYRIWYELNEDNTIKNFGRLNEADSRFTNTIELEELPQILNGQIADKIIDGKLIKGDYEFILRRQQAAVQERANKSRRTVYLDAYRKCQAAVNYGEFERVLAVDEFIRRLRDKDWTAFNCIPTQIRYFAGEVGFAESGLIKR